MNSRLAYNITAESQITSYIMAHIHLELPLPPLELTYVENLLKLNLV